MAKKHKKSMGLCAGCGTGIAKKATLSRAAQEQARLEREDLTGSAFTGKAASAANARSVFSKLATLDSRLARQPAPPSAARFRRRSAAPSSTRPDPRERQ